MNTFTLLVSILLCFAAVNGRHYAERSDMEELADENDEPLDAIRKTREHNSNQIRHRRKRRQMNYGYNYPPPYNPYYLEDRRYYDRNQQELLPQILRLLDEISAYVKRPPMPPPQPIYVPYPVPYPVPRHCNCLTNKTLPDNFPTRIGMEIIGSNQNWGFLEQEEQTDTGPDSTRDLSFDPIRPQKPTTRPAPKVEHGSSQAANDLTTQSPRFLSKQFNSKSSRTPRACDAAALSCCRPMDSREQQRKCFVDLGCGSSYVNGNACSPDSIAAILDVFSKTYSPVN